MEIVKTDVPITWEKTAAYIKELEQAYPALTAGRVGCSAFQRSIPWIRWGTGDKKLLFTAAHHANEWITAPVLLKYGEELAKAEAEGGEIWGVDARSLGEKVSITMVPLVNPDGVDLVTGVLGPGNPQYAQAKAIAAAYPSIPFPAGWKANLLGTDLNLNYPAGWQEARKIKYGLGYRSPAPRDYVGKAPFNQMETVALSRFTRELDPALVVALHTQGQVIYWQFRDLEVPGAEELGEIMAEASGYTLADVPYASSFAGFKDWFIQDFRRPGYTLEVGQGQNPLPLSQFPEIYRATSRALTAAALGEPLPDGED